MMREHFIVDNSTTSDWEVIPLGPVDKEGRKVSLVDRDALCGQRHGVHGQEILPPTVLAATGPWAP